VLLILLMVCGFRGSEVAGFRGGSAFTMIAVLRSTPEPRNRGTSEPAHRNPS